MARGGLRAGSVVVLLAAALVAGAFPASAGEGPATVALEAAPRTLRFGQATTFSGVIEPNPGPGQIVEIVETGAGAPVAQAVTDADGAYRVSHRPSATARYVARWIDGVTDPQSDAVRVRVRARVRARLTGVLLFGRAGVAGRVLPPHPGQRVEVQLRRGARIVARRWARQDERGRFDVRVRVETPGTYRAVALFGDEDHLPGRRVTRPRTTPMPRLTSGSRGIHVRLLERRLRRLGYHLTGVDRAFDHRTGDAVLAFHKVQGMARTRAVSEATWRRLSRPIRPRPRSSRPALHIEIDQTRQVLLVVRRGRIASIVHTSTGRNGWTRDGVFRVFRKIAGYSPSRLYYPSYFDGLRAVHGWPEVPTYPASHGCARVPNWTAVWLHDIMPVGTVVRVYH